MILNLNNLLPVSLNAPLPCLVKTLKKVKLNLLKSLEETHVLFKNFVNEHRPSLRYCQSGHG